MIYILLFIGCVFLSSCSQILLKHSAKKGYEGIRVYLNLETIAGYCIMIGMTLAATLLYRYVELSTGTVLDATGYIFVLGLSVLILKETITKKQMIGMLFILAGTVICCLV